MSESHDRIRIYELSRRVGEILHYIWDPIGISEIPEARDEYDGYLGDITGMLMRGAGKEEISKRLDIIATETMGLSGTSEGRKHSMKTAELLIAHFANVDAKFNEKKNGG